MNESDNNIESGESSLENQKLVNNSGAKDSIRLSATHLSSNEFGLTQIDEVDEKAQTRREIGTHEKSSDESFDGNREEISKSMTDVNFTVEINEGREKPPRTEVSLPHSMSDYYNRKRSQTDNPSKIAAINAYNKGMVPKISKDGIRKDPSPSVELKVSNFNLRESVNDEDVISFRRKAQHQGKFGNIFKFTRQYVQVYNDQEAQKEDGEHQDDVKAESLGRRVVYDNFSTIDWIFDQTKERVRWKKIHSLKGWKGKVLMFWDDISSWVAVIIIGIAVGLLTTYISISTEWMSSIKLGYCRNKFWITKKVCCFQEIEGHCNDWISWEDQMGSSGSYPLFILFACLFGTSAAFIVKKLAPYAAGGGIPECKTIMSGFIIRGFLGYRTLLVKSATLCLSVASGLTLGKEGPLVHIACCIGNVATNLFSKFRGNEAKKRELLSAATAAGVSVAFGAPIGGVLFSLEEVSYYFPHKTMFRTFLCSMFAVSVLQILNPLRTGRLVMYGLEVISDWHDFEILPFIIIGVSGGLFGALFINWNIKMASLRKSTSLKNHPIVEIFLLCLITSLISYTNPIMRVDNGELVAEMFSTCTVIENADGKTINSCKGEQEGFAFLLVLAICLKTILFIITFGAKVPCGAFVPSMAIGSCFGRLVAIVMQAIKDNSSDNLFFSSCHSDTVCINPGTYAMLGAAAFLGGVTRMTVSLTVIMFEITGALTYILPIMLTLMIAKFVGDLFGGNGIAEAYIELNRYPFVDHKEEYHHNIPASKVMTEKSSLITLTCAEMSMLEIENLLEKNKFKGYPIVTTKNDHTLVGYITRSELKYAIKEAKEKYKARPDTQVRFIKTDLASNARNFVDFKPWMDLTPITLTHKFPMATVVDIFRKMGPRYAIVTKYGKLTGLITRKDVLRHLAFMHRFEVKEDGVPEEPKKNKSEKDIELIEQGRAML